MPIFDQGYQHWQGRLSGHGWRWLAITRRGVAVQWRGRGVKWVLAAALGPALLLAGFLIVWGLIEQQSPKPEEQSPTFQLIFRVLQLPEEVKAGPKAYRTVYWTMAFHYFFAVEMFFSMLLTLMVGPNLISQDLRHNAVPLYFSRPVRRFDYFVGKLGVIATFVAAVSIAPAVGAWLLGVAFSFDANVVQDTGRILLASIGYGLVVCVSAGTLMLAISSLSRNSRAVGALWVGLWIIGPVVGQILAESVRQDWCPLVSYQTNLLRIREAMLDTPSARSKFLDLLDVGRTEMRKAQMFAGLMKGGRGGRRFPPNPTFAPPPAPPPLPGYDEDGNSKFPWQWSAYVLGGLLVLSTWILSTRVKSLDRLR
jgi:ABC-2 type transport system permease protein